jgi:hypothetical protein
MSAPTSPLTFDPSGPLSPDLRSEIAYFRARGRSWEDLAGVFKCDPGALRRATEKDPAFAAEQKRAWDEVAWEAEAESLQRLRQVAAGTGERATRVAEALVKYAHERRRDKTRLAIEKMRTAAKLATKARSGKPAEKMADVVTEGMKCRATPAEPTAPGATLAKGEKPAEELSPEAVEVLGRLALSLGKNQAEREGFEPSVRLPGHSISSAAQSTTLPPLRGHKSDTPKRARVHPRSE